jgi:predicted transcriptional regulator
MIVLFHNQSSPWGGDAMNVYDDLLNLINEHGSFLILRERLLLLKEQLEAQVAASGSNVANFVVRIDLLERKVAVLEAQIQELQEENQALQLENGILRKQKQNRDDHLEQQRFYRRKLHLSMIERSVLCHLARYTSRTAEELASGVGIEQTTAAQHLEELKTQGLVHSESVSMVGPIWFLSQQGRRYLVEKSLI